MYRLPQELFYGNHRVEVETGILEAECAAIMQTFFRQGRERKKQAKLAAKAETQE